MKEAYKKVFVVRDAATGIPISYQVAMTLTEAVKRLNREVSECKKCGLDVSDRDYEIYNTKTGEVVL